MQADGLLDLLGLSAADPRVEEALRVLKIARPPEVVYDLRDPDGPVTNPQDWLINRQLGVEIGFEDAASFAGEHRIEWSGERMLLTQVYFYGDHPDVSPFVGRLPRDLRLDDDRATVRRKLQRWEPTRRSYIRDTWELPQYRMIVHYVEDGARLGFVLCMLRPPPVVADDLDIALMPQTAQVLAMLGRSMNDFEFQRVFRALRPESRLQLEFDTQVASFQDTLGFDLVFGFGRDVRELVLKGIVFHRDAETGGPSWPGPLPFGLTFDHSPEQMVAAVGRAPDERFDTDFYGTASWSVSGYRLLIRYSSMENFILRVEATVTGAEPPRRDEEVGGRG